MGKRRRSIIAKGAVVAYCTFVLVFVAIAACSREVSQPGQAGRPLFYAHAAVVGLAFGVYCLAWCLLALTPLLRLFRASPRVAVLSAFVWSVIPLGALFYFFAETAPAVGLMNYWVRLPFTALFAIMPYTISGVVFAWLNLDANRSETADLAKLPNRIVLPK